MKDLLEKMFKRNEGNTKKDLDFTKSSQCKTWFKRMVAFTLAEVLITLGIIGVVAAITIPTLVKNYKKHVIATRLKQNYNLLQNAYNMAIAEYGDPDNWDELTVADSNPGRAIVEKYITPYLKLTQPLDKYTLQDLGYKTPIYERDGKTVRMALNSSSSKAVLANGSILYGLYGISKENSNNEYVYDGIRIHFDLNGASGPNTLGKDAFEYMLLLAKGARISFGEKDFTFNPDTRELVFTGDDYRDDRDRQKAINGCKDLNKLPVYCGLLIMQSGWKFPKDYPLSF